MLSRQTYKGEQPPRLPKLVITYQEPNGINKTLEFGQLTQCNQGKDIKENRHPGECNAPRLPELVIIVIIMLLLVASFK